MLAGRNERKARDRAGQGKDILTSTLPVVAIGTLQDFMSALHHDATKAGSPQQPQCLLDNVSHECHLQCGHLHDPRDGCARHVANTETLLMAISVMASLPRFSTGSSELKRIHDRHVQHSIDLMLTGLLRGAVAL